MTNSGHIHVTANMFAVYRGLLFVAPTDGSKIKVAESSAMCLILEDNKDSLDYCDTNTKVNTDGSKMKVKELVQRT